MARLAERDYTYFRTVRGMCRTCRDIVPARVFFRDNRVWQESLCPNCENEPALIASDQNWYMANILKVMPDCSPLQFSKQNKNGCPHDCGPCTWHASPCQLPVISITNNCNLRCPICFTYNRPDEIYNITVEEMRQVVDWIIKSSKQVDLINITGGEPSLHPDILNILRECKRPEIGRITMNSNGIKLAEDYDLCQKLAEMEIYVILSFNTLDSDISKRLHGRDITELKLRAIDNLTRAGVKMTLLNVMIHDINENAIYDLLKLIKGNDNILSLTVQTMTYTGQGGGNFSRTQHIPADLAARKVCEYSEGILEFEDFFTKPSAHPLCYQICYLLKSGDEMIPFTRFTEKEQIEQLFRDSYLIRPENGQDVFADVINQLYAQGQTKYLSVLRNLVERMYPSDSKISDFQRQKIAEASVRTIYIHSHMDENTFDCSRAMLCPDLVPCEPGKLIPACTYNLFYRMKDKRFYAT